jgi:hypothetical protein
MENDMYDTKITLPKSTVDARNKVEESISPPIPSEHEEEHCFSEGWETPILDRAKLKGHLNALSASGYKIFQILPLDRLTVQVVCFNLVMPRRGEEVNE